MDRRFDARIGDNAYLFRELLKQHRIQMGAANRSKTKKFKNPIWLYPYQYERKYFKQISKWMKVFTKITNDILDENLETWIEEYNYTTKKDGSYKKHEHTEEFKKFLDGENNNEEFASNLFYLQLAKHDIRQDNYSTELKGFIDSLYEEQSKQFVLGGAEKRTFISTIGFETGDFNRTQWQKQLKKLIGTTYVVTEAWETEVIATWAETNFTLIKSLSDEYIKKVNFIVSDGVQQGLGSKELKGQIKKLNKNITEPRARLIARDQVGSLNGRFTKRRQQELDLDMYYWITAGDERVRKSHRGLDGTVCQWGDPGVYSTDGGKSWNSRIGSWVRMDPGQDIQCRCDGPAFFDELIEIVDKEIKAEQLRNLELGPSGY